MREAMQLKRGTTLRFTGVSALYATGARSPGTMLKVGDTQCLRYVAYASTRTGTPPHSIPCQTELQCGSVGTHSVGVAPLEHVLVIYGIADFQHSAWSFTI